MPTNEPMTKTEEFLLARLERVARRSQDASDQERAQYGALARRVILTCYTDCVKIGREREARAILGLHGIVLRTPARG